VFVQAGGKKLRGKFAYLAGMKARAGGGRAKQAGGGGAKQAGGGGAKRAAGTMASKGGKSRAPPKRKR
jgi:hypothetical protein